MSSHTLSGEGVGVNHTPSQPADSHSPLTRDVKSCGVVEAGLRSMYVEWVSMLLNMGFNDIKSRYVSTQILTPQSIFI